MFNLLLFANSEISSPAARQLVGQAVFNDVEHKANSLLRSRAWRAFGKKEKENAKILIYIGT